MTTTWLPVVGFEGLYEVSDSGRVRSIRREGTSGGPICHFERDGYPSVMLSANDRRKPYLVHQLVLMAFVGPRPPGAQAAHRNGDRRDNRPANLYWASPGENYADLKAHSNHRRAMDKRLKLTPTEVEFVRANYKRIKQTDLATMLNVHRGTIQRVHSGERYTGRQTTD